MELIKEHNWQNEPRLKMIEKSEFYYGSEKVYNKKAKINQFPENKYLKFLYVCKCKWRNWQTLLLSTKSVKRGNPRSIQVRILSYI